MDTFKNKIFSGVVFLISFLASVTIQAKTAAELAEEEKTKSLYGEIGIGVLFVVALTLFIIWKSKQDKKEREKHRKQMEQMANRRKAA